MTGKWGQGEKLEGEEGVEREERVEIKKLPPNS